MASPQRTVGNPELHGVASAGLSNFGPALGTDNGDGTFTPVVTLAGGASGGSVTAPGTSGTVAQAVQGITGGVPVAVTGSVTTTSASPYSETADGQTATTASAIAIVAYNGSTVDRLRSVSGALSINAASLPLPTGASQDGTDATGVTPPTGGVGIRGWLSGIYSKLAGTLTTTLAAGTAAIGSVSVSNFPATQAVSNQYLTNRTGTGNTPSYYAGTGSATVAVSANGRVQAINIVAGSSGATLTINGGATITIPAGYTFNDNPEGIWTAPTYVIAGSLSYYIEVVT